MTEFKRNKDRISLTEWIFDLRFYAARNKLFYGNQKKIRDCFSRENFKEFYDDGLTAKEAYCQVMENT